MQFWIGQRAVEINAKTHFFEFQRGHIHSKNQFRDFRRAPRFSALSINIEHFIFTQWTSISSHEEWFSPRYLRRQSPHEKEKRTGVVCLASTQWQVTMVKSNFILVAVSPGSLIADITTRHSSPRQRSAQWNLSETCYQEEIQTSGPNFRGNLPFIISMLPWKSLRSMSKRLSKRSHEAMQRERG